MDVTERFPFGVEFQADVIRMLLWDDAFAHTFLRRLEPSFFDAPGHAWVLATTQQYFERFGSIPTLRVLRHMAEGLEPSQAVTYAQTVETLGAQRVRDEAWLREAVLDFVKRNIFVRGFREAQLAFNSGRVEDAIHAGMTASNAAAQVRLETIDRSVFFEELEVRQTERLRTPDDVSRGIYPTGISGVDRVLEGGLHKGELGIWIGWPKIGKSTMLVALGVACLEIRQARVLHCVFEGSRRQIENRYDAAFMHHPYSDVKRGCQSMRREDLDAWQNFYRTMGDRLVVRGFTDSWTHTVLDIDAEIKELKREKNWQPEVVLVDYGDLLTGHDGKYKSTFDSTKAAFRDLRSLADRGYAVWTATQAQRPTDKSFDEKPSILKSRDVADCYEKVRVGDFIGSLNQTKDERAAKIMRVHAELYRDAPAGETFSIEADFDKMRFADAHLSTGESGAASWKYGS